MYGWAVIASMPCPVKGALKRKQLKVKTSQKLLMFAKGGCF
jgi:hypothetical protein